VSTSHELRLAEDTHFSLSLQQKKELQDYLEYLINFGTVNKNMEMINQARLQIFEFIDIGRIFEDIQKEILTNYQKDPFYD